MEIKLSITDPDKLFKSFLRQVHAEKNKIGFSVKNNIANGEALNLKIENGFWITWFDIVFKKETKIIREANSKSSYIQIIIWFNHDTIRQFSEGKWQKAGKYTPLGVFLSSGNASGQVIVKPNQFSTNLSFTFTKAWFKRYFSRENSAHLAKLFDQLLYKTEPLTPSIEFLVKELLLLKEENRFAKIKGMSYILMHEITEALINQLPEKNKATVLNRNSMDQVREIIASEYASDLTAAYLSAKIGLSTNNLQQIFKKTYKTTLFKYIQKVRIQNAKELLATGNYNVNETGYLVGYTNISHFIKAFKSIAGETPNSYFKRIHT